ncbi:MAG TPA: DUF6512 family protein [Streptosporangiaceae bacterium]|nr:DUF6512 family protein [Streptosporangiaceae bacterium]
MGRERRLVAFSGLMIVVAGTLLHFVYAWSGRTLAVGLLSPVNESVWEHTKLLVIPVLAVGVVEAVVPPALVSLSCLLALAAVYSIWTVAPPALPVFWPPR